MSDKFKTDISVEELIAYIKRTPAKWAAELPTKIQSWVDHRTSVGVVVDSPASYTNQEGRRKISSEEIEAIKKQIVVEVSIKLATGMQSPKDTVDYALEVSEEVIKRLEE